jgi:hypothetical protein
MADTTIRVDTRVRDRLAIVAREQGRTIGELVADLAESTATEAEREARTQAAANWVREHTIPDFNDDDIEAGRQMWRDLEAGRITSIG